MSDIKFTVKSREYNKALNLWAANSKRSSEAILERETKLFVQELINYTPPGKYGKEGTALKRGVASVTGDLNRLFFPVKKTEAQHTDLAGIHKANRTKRGRVKKRIAKKYKVYKPDFNAYLKQQKANIGKLSAGWEPAADYLKIKLPKWISKHSSPGTIDIKKRQSSTTIRVSNQVSYASDIQGFKARINRVAMERKKSLSSEIQDYLDKSKL